MLLTFSANTLDPEILEKTLVGRKKIVDEVEKELLEKLLKSQTYQSLLIASRGSGKTHITKVLHNRIKCNEALNGRVLVAYLNEDERGISNFSDFVRQILTSFIRHKETGHEELSEKIYEISGLPIPQQENAIRSLLLSTLGDKHLVVLMENIQLIFDQKMGMGSSGQGKLRSFIHENRNLSLVATSQNILHQIQDTKAPFYNFFRIRHLPKLTAEQTLDFMVVQAEIENDLDLAKALRTSEFTGKIRAVYALTGGNHRLLVTFYTFLKTDVKSDLSKIFVKAMNDLKPYYEQFLNVLSPQQQKIVKFLSRQHTPQKGKEIARNCFMDVGTSSKQSSDLVKSGYLDSHKVGREAYYELKEPLMRICFEITENSNGAAKLFVDFLTILYDSNEIEKRYLENLLKSRFKGKIRNQYDREAILYSQALSAETLGMFKSLELPERVLESDFEKVLGERLSDFEFKKKNGIARSELEEGVRKSLIFSVEDKGKIFEQMVSWNQELVSELIKDLKEGRSLVLALLGSKLLVRIETDCFKLVRGLDLLSDVDYLSSLSTNSGFDGNFGLHLLLGEQYQEIGALHKAIFHYGRVLKLRPSSSLASTRLGNIYRGRKEFNRAIDIYENGLRYDQDSMPILLDLATTYRLIGDLKKAIKTVKKAVSIEPDDPDMLVLLGMHYLMDNEHESAIEILKRAIELDPTNVNAWYNLGKCFGARNQFDDALGALIKVSELDPERSMLFNYIGLAYGYMGDLKNAELAFQKAFKLGPKEPEYYSDYAAVLANHERFEDAVLAFQKAKKLDTNDSYYDEKIAQVYWDMGNRDRAVGLLKTVISRGSSDILVYNRFGLWLISLGKHDEAKKVYLEGLGKIDDNNWYLNGSVLQVYLAQGNMHEVKSQVLKVIEVFSPEQNDFSSFLEEDVLLPLFKGNVKLNAPDFLDFLTVELKKNDLIDSLWKAFSKTVFSAMVQIDTCGKGQLQKIKDYFSSHFEDVAELKVALMYLDVGIRYLLDNDEKALYDLSKEERQTFKEFVLDRIEE